jgi:hypothetical protein
MFHRFPLSVYNYQGARQVLVTSGNILKCGVLTIIGADLSRSIALLVYRSYLRAPGVKKMLGLEKDNFRCFHEENEQYRKTGQETIGEYEITTGNSPPFYAINNAMGGIQRSQKTTGNRNNLEKG